MTIQDRYELYIDGKWLVPAEGEYIDAINPATGDKLSEFAAAGYSDVDKAVEAARRAFEEDFKFWSKEERVELLLKVANGVKTGRMWVNTYNQFPSGSPFGSYKDSGIGREVDKLAYKAYTQVKNIMIDASENQMGLF